MTTIQNGPISAEVFHHEASHTARIRGKDPFLSRERWKLDQGASWYLSAGRFSYGGASRSEALVSVVAEAERSSGRHLQSRHGSQSSRTIRCHSLEAAHDTPHAFSKQHPTAVHP